MLRKLINPSHRFRYLSFDKLLLVFSSSRSSPIELSNIGPVVRVISNTLERREEKKRRLTTIEIIFYFSFETNIEKEKRKEERGKKDETNETVELRVWPIDRRHRNNSRDRSEKRGEGFCKRRTLAHPLPRRPTIPFWKSFHPGRELPLLIHAKTRISLSLCTLRTYFRNKFHWIREISLLSLYIFRSD